MSECFKDRRTGRSTGLALKYIADAYNRPGFTFPIADHLQSGKNHVANRLLMNTINKMIFDLKLSGFIFDTMKNTMEYRALCNCHIIEQFKEEFVNCGCSKCGKAKA